MLGTVWAFLKDPGNQAVLSWIGGGVVVAAGGIWAVVKFFGKGENGGSAKPGVNAEGGSVAIGGKNENSPINVGAKARSKR
jgi:hypothetical protein